MDCDALGGELRLERLESPEEARPLTVEHVHEEDAGEAELVRALPDAARVHLHPHHAAQDDQRALDDAHRRDRVPLKARVARSVDQVDLAVLPVRMRHGGGQRHTALVLVVVPVGHRRASPRPSRACSRHRSGRASPRRARSFRCRDGQRRRHFGSWRGRIRAFGSPRRLWGDLQVMLSPHERSQAEGSQPDREHDGGGADDPEPGVILRSAPGRIRDPDERRGQQKEERAERGPLLGRRHPVGTTRRGATLRARPRPRRSPCAPAPRGGCRPRARGTPRAPRPAALRSLSWTDDARRGTPQFFARTEGRSSIG